jgi:hypothetical protein
MSKGMDQEKRRAWVSRLERFRQSGLTIAGFCAGEQVSVQTFYYWTRRIQSAESTSAGTTPRGAPAPTGENGATRSHVHFQFGGGVEVSIPADCLEAIRCLAQCLQPSNAAPPVSFHQVLVRDAVREAG